MGRYAKSLILSNYENVIIEANFSRFRYISVLLCFAISTLFLIALLCNYYEVTSDSIHTSDFALGGILFMYPFVYGCLKLLDLLSQEVTLTNKRLIIKLGTSPKKTFDIPINIIQTIQVKGQALSIYSLNGSVASIDYIINTHQLREAIQKLLDTKETLTNVDLQTQALLGISQLNFKKDKGGCMDEIATWVVWLLLVPLMGTAFGLLFWPN